MPKSIARATRTDVNRRRRQIAGLGYRTGANLRPASDWTFLVGGDYPTGVAPATETEALGIPPFGRGVALLANAVAGTEWRAMRWDADAGVALRIPDQPAVLTDPDPTATPWNYKWAAVEDLVLYGNHFALYGDLDYRTLRPGWLVPLPADDVWVITDPETGAYAFTVAGSLLGADELLHVPAGSRSGEVLGRGVLSQYAPWLGGALAAEAHAGQYFSGGALPPAVLQSPTILTQPQADDLKAKWREMTSSREPVILPNGYVLTPIVSNAEQAQLVESRQWNATAVAMMLGIPTYKLGLAGPSMTYQNIESADIEFVRDSVDRYARPLSDAFSKWLMPRGVSVAWDYAGRMRADAMQSATVVTTLTGAKVLTLDEGRAMLGRPPLPEDEQPPESPPEPTESNLTPERPEPGPEPAPVETLTPSEVPQ